MLSKTENVLLVLGYVRVRMIVRVDLLRFLGCSSSRARRFFHALECCIARMRNPRLRGPLSVMLIAQGLKAHSLYRGIMLWVLKGESVAGRTD